MMRFCVPFGSVSYAFPEPYCNFGFLWFVSGLHCKCFCNWFFFFHDVIVFGNNFEFSFKGFAEPLNLEFDLTDYEGNF